ncbi:MAG: hypothetical protein P4M12_11120 [Gammaproteobacteria bacterium]|nr:hypothetical protein [Gammaproteobacteria bacterium]
MRSNATLNSALDLAYSCYENYISPWFKASDSVQNQTPKRHRTRSQFDANKTASLAIPETPFTFVEVTKVKKSKKENKAIKENKDNYITNSTQTIVALLNSFMALMITPQSTPAASTQPEEDSQHEIVTKKIINNHEPISERIRKLEKELFQSDDEFECDQLMLQKIELLSDEIKEHAARRVDLFFYLLISVWEKNITIKKNSTAIQHGQGSAKKGTQACHSSLFPAVKFERAPTPLGWIMSNFDFPTLDGTQFKEALNMTVELPSIVNIFDGLLERKYRSTSYTNDILSLLNKVSQSEMKPIDAMNEFFKIMNTFFMYIEKKYVFSPKAKNPEAFKKVWELEKKGTFHAVKQNTLVIDHNYVGLMLRANEAEIKKMGSDYKDCDTLFRKIQKEIFESKHKDKEHTKQPRRRAQTTKK